MPQTAAKVDHFVYADDPRRIVPPSDATIENWHAGRLLPAFDPDHPPTCELSRRPIDQPMVAYSLSGQQRMDDIQMYSGIEWQPRLEHALVNVLDPQRGYVVQSANGLAAPIVACHPLPFASPPPPPPSDPVYEECIRALTARLMRDTMFNDPLLIRRCLRQCLRWRAIDTLLRQSLWDADALVPEVLVFDAAYPNIILINTVGQIHFFMVILTIACRPLNQTVIFYNTEMDGRRRFLVAPNNGIGSTYVVRIRARPHPTTTLLNQFWMDRYKLPKPRRKPTKKRPPLSPPPDDDTHAPFSDPPLRMTAPAASLLS